MVATKWRAVLGVRTALLCVEVHPNVKGHEEDGSLSFCTGVLATTLYSKWCKFLFCRVHCR